MVTTDEIIQQQRKDIRELQDLGMLQTRKLKQYRELHQACRQLETAYGVNKISTHNAVSKIKRILGVLRCQKVTDETIR